MYTRGAHGRQASADVNGSAHGNPTKHTFSITKALTHQRTSNPQMPLGSVRRDASLFETSVTRCLSSHAPRRTKRGGGYCFYTLTPEREAYRHGRLLGLLRLLQCWFRGQVGLSRRGHRVRLLRAQKQGRLCHRVRLVSSTAHAMPGTL